MSGNLVITWQAVAIFVTLGLAFTGLLLRAIKDLLDKTLAAWREAIDQRFAVLETEIKHVHRLERELLEFKARLPEQYVQREDWVRFVFKTDAKLDDLRSHIDKLIGGLRERT